MGSVTMQAPVVLVRDADFSDNAALAAIAAACPMVGDISLRLTREPDFFALNRLEGTRWRLGVATMDGRVVGCVMGAERLAYLHGVESRTLYAGDLKVHPSVRGSGIANALTKWVGRELAELGGHDVPILLTILAGNRAMERRTAGRGGVPRFARFATMRAFSIPLLCRRRFSDSSFSISRATYSSLEEMVALWRRVAPTRQFAPVFTTETFARWIATAPGLDISSYRLARDRNGRLVGFLAWWDQSCFKQLHVQRYSPRLRAVRTALNTIARFTGGVGLPEVGVELKYCTAVHLCVPGERPDLLRALLRASYPELRDARYAFATIGLDVRDALTPALGGLLAQPIDMHAYVCTAGGEYSGADLAARPLHYEIALV